MGIISIASLIIALIGIPIALYSIIQLRHGIKISFTMDVRRLINRIERNKDFFKDNNPEAYKELFDIQDELETISKKFLAMFNIK